MFAQTKTSAFHKVVQQRY